MLADRSRQSEYLADLVAGRQSRRPLGFERQLGLRRIDQAFQVCRRQRRKAVAVADDQVTRADGAAADFDGHIDFAFGGPGRPARVHGA